MIYFRTRINNIVQILLGLLLLLLVTTPISMAQTDALIAVQQIEATDQTVTVEVFAQNVTDLYGVEFRLRYDPSLVSVIDFSVDQPGIQIEPGTFLPANQGFIVANTAPEGEGVITFAMTLLNPAPAVSGTGPLARIQFDVLQAGVPAEIAVEQAKLVSSDLQTIPYTTQKVTIETATQTAIVASNVEETAPSNDIVTIDNHSLDTTVPTANSTFPWWIVAVILMVVGLIVLVGLMLFWGMETKSPPSSPQQATVQPPNTPSHQARLSPSAFSAGSPIAELRADLPHSSEGNSKLGGTIHL
ncbi:MAG: cohesin domain-containing protein [Chloroflexota bacterium]